jgi:hypothetical protein
MSDAWFSQEFAVSLVWFALLGLLASLRLFAQRGLFRRTIVSLWTVVIAFGTVCLGGFIAGLMLGQPGFVLLPLLVIGITVTATFSATLMPLKRTYWEAEARRTVAQDI